MRRLALAAIALTALAFVGGRAAAFDARNPADVLTVLKNDGATGELKVDKTGAPWIDAQAGKLGFEVDFLGCDAQKTNCKRALYAMAFDMGSITLDQINGWNRWTVLCPAYLTTANHPRVWFGFRPSHNDSGEDVKAQVDIWLGCMSDFDKFTDNPDLFLKSLS